MTSFNYRARDRYGVLASGRMEAESERVVALELEKSELTPISITPAEEENFFSRIDKMLSSLQRVNPEELIVFTRQLNSVLDAGIPLIAGLEAVEEQIRNRKFRVIVRQVKKDIEGGTTFSDALEKHKKVFSPLIVNMVRAGEKAGILPQVLDRISNLIEYDVKTADRIKSATRYPLVVLGTLFIALLVLNIYVIPRFSLFYSSFKMELPLPTRMLVGMNYVLVNFWYWMLGLAILGWYLFQRILETEAGRYNWDRFMLSVPVFGPLLSKTYLSHFGRTLSAMLNSGIPILEALTITSATVENKVIAKEVLGVRDDVFRGKSLAEPMRGSGIFPPIAVSMVAIGEKAGMLEVMLNKMADYFDREVDYTVRNLAPLLEPILILGLGGILLIFALGVYLPMWNVVRIYKTF